MHLVAQNGSVAATPAPSPRAHGVHGCPLDTGTSWKAAPKPAGMLERAEVLKGWKLRGLGGLCNPEYLGSIREFQRDFSISRSETSLSSIRLSALEEQQMPGQAGGTCTSLLCGDN